MAAAVRRAVAVLNGFATLDSSPSEIRQQETPECKQPRLARIQSANENYTAAWTSIYSLARVSTLHCIATFTHRCAKAFFGLGWQEKMDKIFRERGHIKLEMVVKEEKASKLIAKKKVT